MLPHHNVMLHIVTRVNSDDYLAQESLFLRYGYDNLEDLRHSMKFNVGHAKLIIQSYNFFVIVALLLQEDIENVLIYQV